LWVKLMREALGYERFVAAGCDWGSLVSAEIGHAHPDAVAGVHMTLPILPGLDVRSVGPTDYADDERWMVDRIAAARAGSGTHVLVQGNDPQTLAYGLTDSPAGLAAWLWERRRNWSAPDAPMDPDRLCTLAATYWLTDTIASSLRLYAEHRRSPWTPLLRTGKLIPVPTGFALAPHELFLLPRRIAERDTMLSRWTMLPRGGHFLPVEQPAALIDEYRAFVRLLR
jgi:pimeloyl-ACP methyl ester carboxylesterase